MKTLSVPTSRTKPALAVTAAFALSALLGGCALDPVDTKPEAKTPDAWTEGRKTTDAAVSDTWWKAFGDTGLDAAVERALKSSPDIDTAYAKVRAARAASGRADSGFWPTLDTNAAYNRNRTTESTIFPQAGDRTTDNYSVGAGLSYEVDLWGRVRNESAATDNEYRSAHADLAGAKLLVAAETTRLWLNLRQQKAERVTLAGEFQSRSDYAGLLSAREKAGIIGGDDVARATLAAAQAKFDLEALEMQLALTRNALAVAMGEIPGTPGLPEPLDTIDDTIPAIPLSLPSTLLKSRPDVAAADLRLDAALRREGVARANYYPNLTLSATGGFSSISAGDLFQSGSRIWQIGPKLSLPIFTGGKNDADLESARARFDNEWAAYRRTVLTAFRETEDSLLSIDRLANQEKLVVAVVEAATETLTFAKARFDKGLSSSLDVTTAERDTLQAKRALIQIRFDRLRATANLARSLGGGWSRSDELYKKSSDAFEDKLQAADEAAKAAKK